MTDVRLAVRGLAKAPAFTLAVVAVLALGIGASTIIFSIVYGVLLKPLPFHDASRLIAIETTVAGAVDANAYLDVEDWRAQAATLDGVGTYASAAMTLTGRGDTASLPVAMIGHDFFQVLGAVPLLGRVLQARDDARGAPATIVLSERTWRSRFDADPAIVGRAVTLDAKPFVVVGVTPAGFEFPIETDRVEAWIPIHSNKFTGELAEQRGATFLSTVARLRAGRSLEDARAELLTIQSRLAAQYPRSNRRRTGVRATSLQQALVRDYRLALVVLLAAVAAVLLIACANVANLLLARGTSRRREIAIRSALGAARGRLVRQLLTESIVLSIAGGVLGALFAVWGVKLLIAASPIQIPRLQAVHVDLGVLLFALAASIATGLIFGLVPALQLSKGTAEAMKEASRGSSGRGSARTRQTLVVAEMALAVVLLVSAGLLARSLVHLQRVDLGFVPDRAAGMFMMLSESQYPNGAARVAFVRRLLDELRARPQIELAAISTTLPMSGSNIGMGFQVEGRPVEPGTRPEATSYAITADYFKAAGIRLVRGRAFTDRDNETAPPVVVVNETMARKYWPGEDAVGRRVIISFKQPVPREIVGVVADVKNREMAERPEPQIYTPYAQTPWPFVSAVVRTSGEPAAALGQLRAALAKVDPAQATAEVKLLTDYVDRTVATPRFTAALTGGFAAVSLLLAAIGLYGVMAYSVAERRRELGIRMALGAQPSAVRGLVVSEALRLGVAGLALGIAGAFAATRAIAALLFDVTPTDPLTFGGVAALLVGVLLVAAYLPARRATRIDPVVALRSE